MHDRDVRVLPLTTRDAREKLVVITCTIRTYNLTNDYNYFKSALTCVKASSEARIMITYYGDRSNIEYSLDNIEFNELTLNLDKYASIDIK